MRIAVKLRGSDERLSVNFGEVHNVSDGGFERGYAEGYTEGETAGYTKGQEEGIEQGKQSEYDTFWDAYQFNGERTNYRDAFEGKYWDITNFRPKYDIVETDGRETFQTFNHSGVAFDFAQHLEDCGVKLDMSKVRYFSYTFANMNVTRLPVIECLTSSPSLHTFADMTELETIDKLVLGENGSLGTNVLKGCKKLKNIIVEGTIASTGNCGTNTCPFTPSSAKSIINALKNHSGTDTEFTYTLSFSSSVWNQLEADSTSPDGGTWQAYVQSLGWNT